MWLPLQWPVSPAGNGLILARQSHAQHLEIVRNGSWSRLGSGVQGQLEILALYRHLGETSDHFSPSLEVGDVLIFSKCSVHTSSGDNSVRASRQAWQIRFFSEPQMFVRGLDKAYPGMGLKYVDPSQAEITGAKYPRLWPHTLAEEDEVQSSNADSDYEGLLEQFVFYASSTYDPSIGVS